MLICAHPYARLTLSERFSAWGGWPYGIGTLTLTAEGGEPVKTELRMLMSAAGARGTLVAAAQSASRWR